MNAARNAAALVVAFALGVTTQAQLQGNYSNSSNSSHVPASSQNLQTWEVARIIDGDTLIVANWLPDVPVDERVRLAGIDTPERGEPLHDEATALLRRLCDQGSGMVRLEFDDDTPQRGSFGRLVAYVMVGETCANVEMVRAGLATSYTKYGRCGRQGEIEAAEREAQRAGLGVWAE